MSKGPRRTLALAVCLLLLLQGCGAAIAQMERIGPDPDREFTVGAARAEVERELGRPIAEEALADGRTRAVYQYTARVGKRGGPNIDGLMFWADLFTLGGAELVFMPAMYFQKTKKTFRKEFTYGPDDRVTASAPESAAPLAGAPAR
jgi:hypothetical protein